jgi:acetyl-CoA C-acetyltransferase
LHDHKDLTKLDMVRLSAERAYKMAGVTASDISFAEVHDCFSIAEAIVTEELGFFEYCTGGIATGVAQIIEVTEQLRGTAGKRQVENAQLGMAQNMGGSGGSSVVHILEAK